MIKSPHEKKCVHIYRHINIYSHTPINFYHYYISIILFFILNTKKKLFKFNNEILFFNIKFQAIEELREFYFHFNF